MSTYKFYLNLLLGLITMTLVSCTTEKKTYVIGVSQCSNDEWRKKLNDELMLAATFYNNVDLQIKTSNDNAKIQMRQIDDFVNKDKVDLLIVAPGQFSVSEAIDRAYDANIPVILFDRRTESAKFTAYIGTDNREIGSSMAKYLATGAAGAPLRIIELCGEQHSSPAIERAAGFDSTVNRNPNLTIVKKLYTDWTNENTYEVMDSLLSAPDCPEFNCVFAHNDRMAMGARKAAGKHGLPLDKIKFCGVDALPNAGMRLVEQGVLYASFIYPTRGDEVLQLAMSILRGKPFDKNTWLSSALVNSDNAKVLLVQNDEIDHQVEKLATLRGRVDQTAHDFQKQRVYLLIFFALSLLLIGACVVIIRAYHVKSLINKQLKDKNLQIEQMTQTRLQFFTNVSHELRTPLTLIAGPTEQLLNDPTLTRQQRKTLDLVLRNTKILIGLVGQILNFRKVQNDREKLNLSRFSLKEDITLWANDFRPTAEQRKIGIMVNTDGIKDSDNIIADRKKVSHIFFNLMSNAMKYTPAGGTITVTLKQNAQQCTIEMNNTGSYIDTEELPHLFDRFYQAQGAVGGTGIGLALVKAFTDMHNGKAIVSSDKKSGTTFRIILPTTQPGFDETRNPDNGTIVVDHAMYDDSYLPVDTEAEKVARITEAEDSDTKPLVLVIDDNSGMRAYLKSILEEKYNVIEAADGKSGLDRARREVPKLVISDVMMPIMDGLEFTRELKNDTVTSHIPVILLTARSLNDQREEGYETGADSYITKPFSGSVLAARVDNLLRSRKQLHSIFSNEKNEEERQAEEQMSPKDQTFVNKLRTIVQSDMGDSDFSVERLGEKIGLSRVQLYRKVKALTGMTPVELLRKARLNKAQLLLRTTDKSISEIAYDCGFTSPSYFNKCFKDEYGITPGEANRH